MKLKNLFLTLMAVLLVVSAAAQSRKQVRQYNYYINQAELAICDSNYQKASDCYHKAFVYHKPFSRDAYFAFKLNYKYTNNIERAVEAYHFQAQMGQKAIDQYGPIISDTLEYYIVWEQIKEVSDTTISLVIPELQNSLFEILDSDQNVRRNSAQYGSDEEWGKAIWETDSTNWEKLRNLYRTYPVINDYTAGMDMVLTALYIHFRREMLVAPHEVFLQELYKGNVNASLYAHLEDRCMYDVAIDQKNKKQTIYGTNSDYFFCIDSLGFILLPKNVKKIDRERKRILLSETWEDYAKKICYLYRNDTEFNIVPLTFVYQGNSEETGRLIDDIKKENIKGAYYILPNCVR